MRGAFAVVSGSVLFCACAASSALGGSALVRGPIEQQCSRGGLKSCPELVDGVVLYVEGDEAAAAQRLKRAASQNTPEDMRRFLKAISVTLPAKSGGQLAALLAGDVASDTAADVVTTPLADDATRADVAASEKRSVGSPDVARLERAQLAMAAPNDPMRLTTESVSPQRDADRARCTVGDSDAVCVRLEAGPLIVTDAITPPGCATELIIGATDAEGHIGWMAPTTSPGFHGARFFVRSNQRVVVAARKAPIDDRGDERCYVTWAAFKPRVWLQNP